MPSIKQEMTRGVFWSAVEKYSGLVVSIIVSMILARLLSPEEYGVVAIATVIIHFLQMFCTMGIGPAIIQRRDLSNNDLNSIFTFSLSIGVFLACLFFFGSWCIASFYENELLVPICQILSIQVFFAAANMVPSALMNRNKRFKEIAKRTLLLQSTSGVLSIIAALSGAGVYSLLISPVITAVGIFIWNRHYYKVSIDWRYNLEPIKRIFSFSIYQFLFDFVNYFSRNLDKLIIGKYISVDALGVYEKSYRLMQLPMNNVTAVINPVLQPVLNGLQDDKQELSRKYLKLVKIIAAISFPMGILLAGMSEEAIRIFYGGKWDAAIPVFRLLALSLPLQMIQSTSGAIFLVCGATKDQFWVGIRNTVTTILGFVLAIIYFGTIESVAASWTISLLINFILTYYHLFAKVLKTSVMDFYKKLIKPIFTFVSIAVIFGGIVLFVPEVDTFYSLIIKVLCTVPVALVTIQLTGQLDIKSQVTKILHKIKK